ncbi:MAG: carbohydrate ABC transporter permease, partial [Clostridiales bacterium]|nr:carbohydrate ABC transporter permease [Clostridiales bacterium]
MKKKRAANFVKTIVCLFMSLIVLAPFYMVVINSFKTKNEAARMSLSLPTEWMFSNYIEVIDKGNLVQGFFNSLCYAGISTTIGVVLCSMAAFVLS